MVTWSGLIFLLRKRKICLMLVNCSAHKNVPVLKAIKCVYLPSRATCKTLALWQKKYIQCLKTQTENKRFTKLFNAFTIKQNFLWKHDVETIIYLRRSWNSVTTRTVKNGTRHTWFAHDINKDTYATESSIVQKTWHSSTDFVSRIHLHSLRCADCEFDGRRKNNFCISWQIKMTKSKLQMRLKKLTKNTKRLVSLNESNTALKNVQRFFMKQKDASWSLDNLHEVLCS